MGGASILLAAAVLVFVVPELKILQSLESKIPQQVDDQLKA